MGLACHIKTLSKRRRRRWKKRMRASVQALRQSQRAVPKETAEAVPKGALKYWLQRYNLFSRFDLGVRLDEEGWYSVTPEEISRRQAARCCSGVVIDAFAGVGGNSIQFAYLCPGSCVTSKKQHADWPCKGFGNCLLVLKQALIYCARSHHVIAVDINFKRLLYAQHNAAIYGVSDRIDFIAGDFFKLASSLKADVIFLSPPWGGPDYLQEAKYDIETMLRPKSGFSLFKIAMTVAPNVAFFLPRNVDCEQLDQLSWLSSPPLAYEVEKNFLEGKLKAITAYYGDIVMRTA